MCKSFFGRVRSGGRGNELFKANLGYRVRLKFKIIGNNSSYRVQRGEKPEQSEEGTNTVTDKKVPGTGITCLCHGET